MTYQQHLETISNNFVSFGKKLNNIFSKSNRDSESDFQPLTAPNNEDVDDDDQLLDSSIVPTQNSNWLNSGGFHEPEESAIPPSNHHLMNRNSPFHINTSATVSAREVPLDDFVNDSGPSAITPDPDPTFTSMPFTYPASQNDPKLSFSENEGPSARLRSTTRGTANAAESDGETNHFSFGRKPGNSTGSGSSESAIKPKWRYDDFETIDWLRDMARDRQRRRNLLKRVYGLGFLSTLLLLWDAASGWICVLFAGFLTGLVAVIIDIGAAWMSDLREGVCTEAWWLSKEQCCWTSDTLFNDSSCAKWHTYASLVGLSASSEGLVNASWLSVAFNYSLYVTTSICLAVLAAVFVKVFAPYACGSGIGEIKTVLSGFVMHGYLGKWTLSIKSLGLALATASGLCIGKEGPMVHIGACCGNIVAYVFPKYGKNEAKKREIISAATAAGVAVAFGAPTGGILFSLEEISYYFPLKTLWRSLFCAVASTMVFRWINPYGNERSTFFSVEYKTEWSMIELVPIVFIGILGGIWGAIFIRANIAWCRTRKTTRLGKYPILEIFVLALVTSVIGFLNPYTRMNSLQLMKIMVSPCEAYDTTNICNYPWNVTNANTQLTATSANPMVWTGLWQLALALLFRCVFTTFSVGTKVPTGLFIPNMIIGAVCGRIVGVLVEQLAVGNRDSLLFEHICRAESQPCINPAFYGMVGAAAFLGGVTRMTVSLVVIVVELTHGMEYVVPLMIAVMFAKWVGDWLCPKGINEAYIELNNYPFLDNKLEFTPTSMASDVMRPRPSEHPLEMLTQDTMTVEDIEAILQNSEYNGFPVVTSRDRPHVIGFIERKALQHAIENARRRDGVVGRSPVYLSEYVQRLGRVDSIDASPTATPFFSGTGGRHSAWPGVSVGGAVTRGSSSGGPVPLHLFSHVDLAPVTVTERTPMAVVIDLFRKLGLRQALVTKHGMLVGIITKKDVVRHVLEFQKEPRSLLFS